MIPHIHLGLEGVLPLALYTAGIVAFLASVFWRPSVGVYVLALALPLQMGRYRLHDLPLGAQFLDIQLLGVALGLLRTGKPVLPRTPVTRFLIVLTVFYYLSLWQGSLVHGLDLPFFITDERFSNWKNYVELFFMGLVAASAIRTERQVKMLLLCMAFTLLLVNRSYSNALSATDLSHFNEENRQLGPLGYAGANGLAAFEAMIGSFMLGIVSFKTKLPVKAGIFFLLSTSMYCLAYAFSRGGYLGMVVGTLAIGVLKNRKLLIVLLIVFVAWEAILPASVQERILMTKDPGQGGKLESSAQSRLDMWEDAMEFVRSNPVLGGGYNTYEFMGRVGPYRDTHNYYVKVLFETGVVGLVLFIVLLRHMFRSGYRLFKMATDPFWASIGLGFVGLMSAISVSTFFGDRWTLQQVDGYMWLLFGCVLRGLGILEEQAAVAHAPAPAEDVDAELVASSSPETVPESV